MIIKDIRLTNFGKFNHKMVTLEPGLNIVYGENEAGKTTLHTFIRGMLFGIEKQRGKASGKDLYTKYEPWENPANYHGMMRIESDGVTYRIERNFNKLNKSFKVINEDEGIELKTEEIENLFAGLDESCYYNTISISQLGSVTDKELEVILKNYAANLGTTKSMEIDIKSAFADLDKQKKNIMIESRIAEEDVVEKAIKNVKEDLEISQGEQHTIIASIEQKKQSLFNLSNKKKELSALDAKRLEALNKLNERKENLYQEAITLTADSEKFSASLEQIENHQKQLEQELADKGIDGRETMEYLLEKVTNRSNMPVLFIILMMGCIGGAFGALFASVTGLGATGTGVTGIFGILLCLNNPVSYILMFVIAFGAAFVLTWLFGYKDTNVSEKTESVEAVGDKSTTEKSNADDSVLYSVSEGTAILLSQVNDATFASEVLGKGIAVIPSKGEVVAPCDAVVETVFDTKHAVGLSTESGMELLIHIGINTVELNGKYFTSHVKNGDHVKKGQLLVSFDMEKVKAAGYDVTTPLIVTNSDDYKDVKILSEDSVTPSDKVLEIVK